MRTDLIHELFLFRVLAERLRSENRNLPSAFEQARRRVNRRCVGLGATRS